jgi:spore coat protein JC
MNDKALYFVNGDGVPWVAQYIQSKGDPIADLHEDMAAEQKARATYEYLIQLSDDPGVTETLAFLRQREIVHYQRFGETLQHIYDYYSKDKYYFMGE